MNRIQKEILHTWTSSSSSSSSSSSWSSSFPVTTYVPFFPSSSLFATEILLLPCLLSNWFSKKPMVCNPRLLMTKQERRGTTIVRQHMRFNDRRRIAFCWEARSCSIPHTCSSFLFIQSISHPRTAYKDNPRRTGWSMDKGKRRNMLFVVVVVYILSLLSSDVGSSPESCRRIPPSSGNKNSAVKEARHWQYNRSNPSPSFSCLSSSPSSSFVCHSQTSHHIILSYPTTCRNITIFYCLFGLSIILSSVLFVCCS